jgi:hypothetical protein
MPKLHQRCVTDSMEDGVFINHKAVILIFLIHFNIFSGQSN